MAKRKKPLSIEQLIQEVMDVRGVKSDKNIRGQSRANLERELDVHLGDLADAMRIKGTTLTKPKAGVTGSTKPKAGVTGSKVKPPVVKAPPGPTRRRPTSRELEMDRRRQQLRDLPPRVEYKDGGKIMGYKKGGFLGKESNGNKFVAGRYDK